ncbi:MAG TPA: beta-propeller fold lactonase family protein [Burkholderiaceae bacterium]
MTRARSAVLAALLAASCFVARAAATAEPAPAVPGSQGQWVPSGQTVTPLAARGSTFKPLNPGLKDLPEFTAGQAVTEVLSPDLKTLLVLTSGFNNNVDERGRVIAARSYEYVFVFDVSSGAAVQRQVLQVPDTYAGIAFAPDGSRFYVSGGGDDVVHGYAIENGIWAEAGPPISLGHASGNGVRTRPLAAGIAVTADGSRAVVANWFNDSISIVDLAHRRVAAELDLRPGKTDPARAGVAGGENPFWVSIAGNATAFVTSVRDREVVVVDIGAERPAIKARLAVRGNPNKSILNRAQTRLYVAADNSDSVDIIDTVNRRVAATIRTVAPAGLLDLPRAYGGASPNGLALSHDEARLYVTNRGTNSVAVIALDRPQPELIGLVPTGWYPSDVAVDARDDVLYVVNSKSAAGPDPGNCLGYGAPCIHGSPVRQVHNQYVEQLAKAGFQTVPVPNRGALAQLTRTVARNNGFDTVPDSAGAAVIAGLRQRIRHVIYIVKENRTYDQVLGDLDRGNGDRSLAEFPAATTPNLHALASQFVTLDNFYDSGEVSGNGWPWSTAARESDVGAKMLPVAYARSPIGGKSRGGTYDWEGANRDVNVGLPDVASRVSANPLSPTDPDLLPGTADVAAPDGPGGERQQGYLWNAALRKGLSVRNYGFFIDLARYRLDGTPNAAAGIERDRAPFAHGVVQSYPTNPDLMPITDPYFRGFDDAYPDFYREREWEREFAQYVRDREVPGRGLPALSLVRFMADHTGAYKLAIDGVDTPEIQVADNDYAVGRLVAAVAASPYASDTLIFVVEDDAQDGPDHVDAHRSTAFVAGPCVRQGALVSERYTTVNLLRTITDLLGLDHLGLYDATQRPMTEVFDLAQERWSFTAVPSALLASTRLPLPEPRAAAVAPTHDAAYWIERTRDMDFSEEDKVDAALYNRVLWQGLMGDREYPGGRGAAGPRDDQPD